MNPPTEIQNVLKRCGLIWVSARQEVPTTDHHGIYNDPNERLQIVTKPVLKSGVFLDAPFSDSVVTDRSSQKATRHEERSSLD